MQSHLLPTDSHKTLIGKYQGKKDPFSPPVAVSFKAELRWYCTFPGRSKKSQGEPASTSAVLFPFTTTGCFISCSALLLCTVDHLSAIYQRYFLIWARRLTNTMFNAHQTVGTCGNEPAWSFACVGV